MYQAIVQSLRYFLAPIYELHEIRQVQLGSYIYLYMRSAIKTLEGHGRQ